MVSWTSSARAIAIFVPTPSVEVASKGRRYARRWETSTIPAKPPSPPTTLSVSVRPTAALMSSTAASPASVSTPAAAYAEPVSARRDRADADRPAPDAPSTGG